MKYNLVYQFDCTCMKIPFLSVSAGLFLVGFCKFGLCLFVNVPSRLQVSLQLMNCTGLQAFSARL